MTAANGKAFLTQLSAREAQNSLFDFLKPSHALFGYFTTLVDQYHRILHPPAELLARVAADAATTEHLLLRSLHRLEVTRRDEEKKRAAAADGSGGASSAVHIDWHDFVVVETITLDGNADAPPGASDATVSTAAPSSLRGLSSSSFLGGGPDGGGGGGERIVVRTDYVPLSGAAAAPANRAIEYLDPRTGHAIPIDAATQHVRIDTADPRGKAERAVYLARRADSLFVPGSDVAENLKRLAQARPDVFADRAMPLEVNAPLADGPPAKRPRIAAPPPAPAAAAMPRPDAERAPGEDDDDDAAPGT